MDSYKFKRLISSVEELVNQYDDEYYIEHLLNENLVCLRYFVDDLESWIKEFNEYKLKHSE